ncbi:hypothetical protein MLD52_06790 [Puniceicoccaceae bacterium K14]|nr:hypothetical protein [Puniceicoccaceae bacterium K14]
MKKKGSLSLFPKLLHSYPIMANKSKPSKSDERNVIPETTEIADIEANLSIFWSKYGKQIILAIVAVFVVFLGYQFITMMGQKAEEDKQAAYAEASSDDAKLLEWAEKESGHPLSGLAFKELADKAYTDEKFQEAVSLYEKASDSTKESVKQASQIGQAMSLLALDKESEAKTIFQSLALEENNSSQLEAKYRLAIIALKNGDTIEASAQLDEILAGDQRTLWAQKANQLKATMPATADEIVAE